MNRSCVAISTTGHAHRLPMLARTVKGWDEAGIEGMFVTVDGTDEDAHRVYNVVSQITRSVFRVGQANPPALGKHVHKVRDGRLGVAVNKNTGLELMMGATTTVEHLFLSDDDTFPTTPHALALHIDNPLLHSMVAWGYHRLGWTHPDVGYAEWDWPRGSLLYVRRRVVEQVGGMIEAFGPGGHEHVEWSRRIHAAGLTPCLYPSPMAYAVESTRTGQVGMGAENWWDAVDMPKDGEHVGNYHIRKAKVTTIHRTPEEQAMIDDIMRWSQGWDARVPYEPHLNNRGSATLYPAR